MRGLKYKCIPVLAIKRCPGTFSEETFLILIKCLQINICHVNLGIYQQQFEPFPVFLFQLLAMFMVKVALEYKSSYNNKKI